MKFGDDFRATRGGQKYVFGPYLWVRALAPLALWVVGGCSPVQATYPDRPIFIDRYFSWDVAPNGHAIVWSAVVRGKARHLFLRDLRTLKLTRLQPVANSECYPKFSADGNWISFQGKSAIRAGGHIYVRSVDGRTGPGDVRQVTFDKGANDETSSFSSDGKRLAFSRALISHPEKTSENMWDHRDAYTVNLDGSHLKRLTQSNTEGVLFPYFVNGDREVLFNEPIPGQRLVQRISLVASDGSAHSRPIVEKKDSCGDISVHPDGRHFVFTSPPGSDLHSRVYCASTNGTECAPVSEHPPSYGVHLRVAPQGHYYYRVVNETLLWKAELHGWEGHPTSFHSVFDIAFDPQSKRDL